jgi:hypothetical protein
MKPKPKRRVIARIAICALSALCLPFVVRAAAVTHRIATASTSNATSYASGSFTPAAGDLLIAFVVASDTVAAGTMTDSQSLGFTKVTSALKNSSADTVYAFVANANAAASPMTVTFDCTGDAATGAIIFVASVSGISRVGPNAIAQSAIQENQASGTPAISFTNAVNTSNPTLGCVGNSTNPATLTPPTSWTEDAAGDTGYNAPATGGEYVFRNSGFTSTTITWGGTSGSAFGGIALEINASSPSHGLLTLGVGD